MTVVVHRMGDRACLAETADPLGYARAVRAAARDGALRDVSDVVPAATTVLITSCADNTLDIELLARLRVTPPVDVDPGPSIRIPVVYDGEDLPWVTEHLGLSTDQVIALHSAGTYRVEFCGFAPGFGYLSGVDRLLHVPRWESPRARVPAGSVALAAGYSAVYPRASPGGWRLIGRTNLAMFDPHRDPAALLAPGTIVTFDPVSALPEDPLPVRDPIDRATASWEVLQPGLLTLVQDLGRPGHGAIAVSSSGAFDRTSFTLANRLVGNEEDCAGLEAMGGGLTLRALRPATLAVTGAEPRVLLDGVLTPGGVPMTVLAGQVVELLPPKSGLRCYVALRGGLQMPTALGSCASDTLGGLGPAPVAAGDLLAVGSASADILVDHHLQAATPSDITLRTIWGPRRDWFTDHACTTFASATFTVSGASDRIGMRLEGPVLERRDGTRGSELPPEGMVRGAIQVPPSGQPLILGPDHPTTGGYPVIAVIANADHDALAQAAPGTRVKFDPVR